jgi:hypothetical protein
MPNTDLSRPAIDFDALIADRAQGFSGRGWVLEAVGRWLARPQQSRIFLLTGDPGTGKTAVAARIVQLHRGDPAAGAVAGLPPGVLSAYHFCQVSRTDTVSPLDFVTSVAHSLANRHPEYREFLQSQGSTQYRIEPVVNVHGGVAPGGTAIGAQFNVTIEVRSGDAVPLFDQLLRRPLDALYAAGHRDPVTILVDSLDEALWFDPDSNITQLLRIAGNFPPQVRFLLTCRTGNTRVFEIVGPPALDLVVDAPPGLDEVRDYAKARLVFLPHGARTALAERVAQQSKGNFLYARHVLRELESASLDAASAALVELPDSLEDVYRQSIKRGLAARPTLWHEAYRPLLGLIAVARGDGLPWSRLLEITGLPEDRAGQVLATCRQYLVGGEDGRPYRIYHQSFRDFLLQDAEYGVVAHERHASLARYLENRYGGSWATCTDEYALRYTPAHWAEAARLSEVQREDRVRALIELLGKSAYRRRFERRVRDLSELQAYARRAVVAAATLERAEALPWLIRAANGHVSFRQEFLQGQSVVKLAEAGEIDLADARLGLYAEIGEDWRQAARLILAWQGAAVNRDAAVKLLERARPAATTDSVLSCLDTRVAAELGQGPDLDVPSLPNHSLEVAQAIVQRLGGQEFNRELLMSLGAGGPLGAEMETLDGQGYAARVDAPILVAAARDFGPAGTALLDRYVDAHAGYQYVEYRNRSLWFVLEAVLRLHPDRAWVRERLGRILAAALTGGGQDYREMLRLTASLLQHQSAGDLTAALDERCDEAVSAAGQLQPQRGVDDSWGTHRRRLTALYELAILLAGDDARADALLQRVLGLPGGFAGFQAPALLRQADALVATGRAAHPARARSLDDALESAHHVQDVHFCARVTARCNALRRWHATTLDGPALAETIARLAAAPADEEFAADHRVHEDYVHRAKGAPGTLPIDEATHAETLEQLADLFQRPVLEFRRLNPAFDLEQTIPDGTMVLVPDPGLVPLLAAHLAARCFADQDLEDERPRLIRSLVPVALANATALDTVLSYLLAAVQPDAPGLLAELVAQAGAANPTDVAAGALDFTVIPATRRGGIPS